MNTKLESSKIYQSSKVSGTTVSLNLVLAEGLDKVNDYFWYFNGEEINRDYLELLLDRIATRTGSFPSFNHFNGARFRKDWNLSVDNEVAKLLREEENSRVPEEFKDQDSIEIYKIFLYAQGKQI